ncbi:MAG: SDR family oxidoreductase [Nocardioides sp.]|uniref:SDR family oxidoreductase n=1 Tax=Nocardioides sp. TaxID=35761 RepID=UPI003F106AAE
MDTTRTVAVTGAASGIGKATAELLRARGDRVIDVDLRDATVTADLSTQEGRDHAVAEILRLSDGVLDGLVTCAGTSQPSTLMVRINYFGTTRLVEALQPALAASPAGRVAIVASLASTQGRDDALVEACLADDEDAAVARAGELEASHPHPYVIYPSSKWAVARWARRTAVAPGWADQGITVNAVGPGVVRTPMTDGLFADPAMKEVMDAAMPSPLGYAQPEAIGAVLGFLVSAEASNVTGQLLFVDSGADATVRPDISI